MHVLIIPSWYKTKEFPIRGIFFQEQAIAVKKKGCKVGILKPEPRQVRHIFNKGLLSKFGLDISIEKDILTYRYFSWNYLPRIPYGISYVWIKLGLKLFKIYIKNEGMPDIIHAHSALFGGYLAKILAKKYNIPYVITEHSSAYAKGGIKGWKKNVCLDVFNNASESIVVSPSLGNLMEKTLGSSILPLKWIPNILGIDYNSVPKQIKNKKSDFVFLNIGVLKPVKDQALLIKAFSKAFLNNSKVKLRIGGDGPIKQDLEKLIVSENLSDQVELLGELDRDQVAIEMNNCDCFVLTSVIETFGVVVIEALAFGKPVIATKCGGPEVIVNEDCGLLIESRNENELIIALIKIKDTYDTYSKEKIKDYCINTFGEKAVAAQILDVYKNILS